MADGKCRGSQERPCQSAPSFEGRFSGTQGRETRDTCVVPGCRRSVAFLLEFEARSAPANSEMVLREDIHRRVSPVLWGSQLQFTAREQIRRLSLQEG